MKIMIYYLGVNVPTWTQEDVEVAVANKTQFLVDKFPGYRNQILVVPLYDSINDKIEVVDMAPTSYPNTYYPIPNYSPTVVTAPFPAPFTPNISTTMGTVGATFSGGLVGGAPGSAGMTTTSGM